MELGRLAAEAVETVAARLSRKESERQIAARLNAALLERGLEPVVTLVAADGRMHRYRHPIPTDNVVERSAMLVSCARKGGLIASLTRLVHFGRLSKDLEERHAAVVQIDAAIMQRTRPGKSGADLFDDLTRLYAEAGFPASGSSTTREAPPATRAGSGGLVPMRRERCSYTKPSLGTLDHRHEIRGHHRRHRGRLYLADPRERQVAGAQRRSGRKRHPAPRHPAPMSARLP